MIQDIIVLISKGIVKNEEVNLTEVIVEFPHAITTNIGTLEKIFDISSTFTKEQIEQGLGRNLSSW